jgi:hypothetical protein
MVSPKTAARKSRLDDILASDQVEEVINDNFDGRATLGSTLLAQTIVRRRHQSGVPENYMQRKLQLN